LLGLAAFLVVGFPGVWHLFRPALWRAAATGAGNEANSRPIETKKPEKSTILDLPNMSARL
jgi:hypothetical protein